MSSPEPFLGNTSDPTEATTPPDFFSIARDLAAGVIDSKTGDWLAGKISDGVREALVAILGFILKEITTIIGYFVETFVTAESSGETEVAKLASVVVSSLVGSEVDPAAFSGVAGRDQRAALATLIGKQIISAMFGANLGDTPQTLQPSSANAEKFAGVAMHLSVEGWLEGLIAELVSLGQIEQVGQLKDTIINAMGIGRLMRRVLAPPTTILIEDPFSWKLNAAFRPKLLGEGLAVKQKIRGRWDLARLDQELGRQGYSAEGIEALINDSRRFLSEAELEILVRYKRWTLAQAVQHLMDQGYEEPIAQAKMDLEQLKRNETVLGFLISGLEDARIKGFLDNTELRDTLSTFALPADEIDLRARSAAVRAELPRANLTIAEAVQAFDNKILDLTELRQQIDLHGYRREDAQTLELLYVAKLKATDDAKSAKEQQAKDKAAAKAQAAKDKAEKAAATAEAKATAAATKAQQKSDARAAATEAKATAAATKAQQKSDAKAATDAKKQQLATAKANAAAVKTAQAKADRAAALAVKATAAATKAAEKAAASRASKDKAAADAAAARAAAALKKAAADAALAAQKQAARLALDAQKAAERAALDAQKAAERERLAALKAAAQSSAAKQPAAPKPPKKAPPKKTGP